MSVCERVAKGHASVIETLAYTAGVLCERVAKGHVSVIEALAYTVGVYAKGWLCHVSLV